MYYLPVLIKYGIRNRPDNTLSLNECNVLPSNGSAPQTNTYSTTPMLCENDKKKPLTYTIILTLYLQFWERIQHVQRSEDQFYNSVTKLFFLFLK